MRRKANRLLAALLILAMIFTSIGMTDAKATGEDAAPTGVITDFGELAGDTAEQKVSFGTSHESLKLPDKLEAAIDGSPGSVTASEWRSVPEYDGGTAGIYVFTAELPEEYTLADGVKAPSITVTVAAEEMSDGALIPDSADGGDTSEDILSKDQNNMGLLQDNTILGSLKPFALTASNDEAYIGTPSNLMSLQTALNTAVAGQTVVLVKNVENAAGSQPITLDAYSAATGTITLNLNGYTISGSTVGTPGTIGTCTLGITDGKKLIITDTAGGGGITNTAPVARNGVAVEVYGGDSSVDIKGGAYSSNWVSVYAQYAGTVTLAGGTFTGGVQAAGLDAAPSSMKLAPGYISDPYLWGVEKYFTVRPIVESDYVAAIENTKYVSLQEALDAATAGQTVVLVRNIEIPAGGHPAVLDQDAASTGAITLDLKGFTISGSTVGIGITCTLAITGGKELIITDTAGGGGIKNTADNGVAIVAQGSGTTLDIRGGTYTGGYVGVFAQTSAAVTLTSGTFTGGTYGVGTPDTGTFKIATGSIAEPSTGWRGLPSFSVRPATADDYVAYIGTNGYATLHDALNAVANNQTIVIAQDIRLTVGENYPVSAGGDGGTITIDLNGKTISNAEGSSLSYLLFVTSGNVTIINSDTSGGGFSNNTSTSISDPNPVAVGAGSSGNSAALNITGGTYYGTFAGIIAQNAAVITLTAGTFTGGTCGAYNGTSTIDIAAGSTTVPTTWRANSYNSVLSFTVKMAAPEITITTQPSDVSVFEDEITGSLRVVAQITGTQELKYQWYSSAIGSTTDGVPVMGAVNSSFTIPTTLETDTYYYYCVVSADGAESVATRVAKVTVQACVAQIGSSRYATLQAALSAVNTNGQVVKLMKDVALDMQNGYSLPYAATLDLNGHTISNSESFASTALFVVANTTCHFTITDSVGGGMIKSTYVSAGTTSAVAASGNGITLNINGGTYSSTKYAVFAQSAAVITLTAGTFSGGISGAYYYSGTINIAEGSVTNPTEWREDDIYSVPAFTVGPAPPEIIITTQPAAQTTVTVGSISGSLRVEAEVSDSSTPSYQWYRNTSNSNAGGTAIPEATGASYTIPTTLAAGTYYYFCEVSAVSAASVRSSVAAVVVQAVLTYGVTHNVSGSLHSFDAAILGYGAQEPLTVTVTNSGTGSATGLSVALDGTNESSFLLNTTGMASTLTGTNATSFTVTPKAGLSADTYTATVNITGDNGISASFTVSFMVKAPLITILTQPATETTVTAGSISGSLRVEAETTGTQELTYQWYSNTSNSNTGGTAITGATYAAYTIPTILTAGTYYYFCEVSADGADSVRSSVATVVVRAMPTYGISHDVDGGSYTFDAAVLGYDAREPLTVNVSNTGSEPTTGLSVALAGTNAGSFTLNTTGMASTLTGTNSTTFTVTPNTGLEVGTYTATVEITGDNGITESFDVSFETVAPTITIQTQPAAETTVTEGSITVTLTVAATVTGNCLLNYQWYSNTSPANTGGMPITNATEATYTIPTDLPAGTYYYYCVVSAAGAQDKSSNAATVTVSEVLSPIVTNTNDSGTGSLRAAVKYANLNANTSITFSIPITDSGYDSGTGMWVITLETALPDIAQSLTINGPAGGVEIRLASGFTGRHLASSAVVTLTLENLTLTGNSVTSGAGYCGGIQIMGVGSTLNMKNCTVQNCYADDDGGGIRVEGTSVLTDCTISGNSALSGGGMRAVTAILTRCIIKNNVLNSSSGGGGGICTDDSVTLTDCTLSGNTAIFGGGVYSDNTAALTNCTLISNTAKSYGGGVHAGTAALTNCTVTANTAETGSGGGVHADTTAKLINCTVTANTTETGFSGGVNIFGAADIYGSIVAGNTGVNVYANGSAWSDVGLTGDGNYNIIGTPVDCSLTDIFGTSTPTLADNGGSTKTIRIDPNGPAYNAIPAGTAWLPSADQRGVSRPQGTNGDIGAVELRSFSLTVSAGTNGSLITGTSGSYAEGQIISIAASPNSGYAFGGWTSSGSGSFTNPASADTTFIMPGADTAIAASFIPKEATPSASIDYVGEKLTGFTANEVYTINNTSFTVGADGEIPINAAWFGTILPIVKKAGIATADSDAQILSIPARRGVPAVTGMNETIDGQNDGLITGVTTAMEYSSDSGFTWTDCPGTEITALEPGSYLVRYKAVVGNSFKSNSASVSIATGAAQTRDLTVTAPAFANARAGYTRPADQGIDIYNSGNSTANIASVTVTGTAFEISGSGASVASGQSIDTWRIQPEDGLTSGTYTATITVTYDGGVTATAQVSFTVEINPDELAEAIKEAENLNEDDYTPKSWKDLEDALREAKEAQNKADVTQSELDAAKDVLTDAINALKKAYKFISGFSTFTGSGDITGKVDVPYTEFVRLLINGIEVASGNYTVTEGSTVITLKEAYLKTLANDTYTVTVEFESGYAETTLTVQQSASSVSYTVTFNSNGGTSVASQTVKDGRTVTKPADPTRTGYTFSGWYSDQKRTTAWDFDKDTVSGDMTLYAKWTTASGVKTGDDSTAWLWLTLLGVSALGIAGIGLTMKRFGGKKHRNG